MATAKGYTDDDRKRIVSAMQSMRDRLGGFLAKTYGDNFDGDIDLMLEAINFMKALRIERPDAPLVPVYHPALDAARDANSRYFNPRTDVLWGAIESALALRDLLAVIDSAAPAQQPAAAVPEGFALVRKWREQANAALRRSGTWNGNDMADRIDGMADELAAMLAAANKESNNG